MLELVLHQYERIRSHVGVKQCAVPVISFAAVEHQPIGHRGERLTGAWEKLCEQDLRAGALQAKGRLRMNSASGVRLPVVSASKATGRSKPPRKFGKLRQFLCVSLIGSPTKRELRREYLTPSSARFPLRGNGTITYQLSLRIEYVKERAFLSPHRTPICAAFKWST